MIPNTWDKISTQQFMQFNALNKVKGKDAKDTMNILIQKAAILSGLDMYEAEKIPISELSNIKKLAEQGIKSKIYKSFQLNGIWYEVILNPNDLTSERYAGVMEASKVDPIQGIAKTLFYLCKPFKKGLFGRKYYEHKEGDIPKIIEGFNDLPITISYPIAVFFLTLLKEYTDYSLTYSKEKMTQMKEEILKAQADLLSHTDGLKQ